MKYYLLTTILLWHVTSHAQDLLWAADISGVSAVTLSDVKVDAEGNSYLIGTFMNTVDVDPGPGTFYLTAQNSWVNTYIVKLNPDGNLVWGGQLNGITLGFGGVSAKSITLDSVGSIYVAGSFEQTVDFDPGVADYTLTSNGSFDIFILSLDTAGNFQWAHNLGDVGSDRAKTIKYANGFLYIDGEYRNTVDFNPGGGTNELTSSSLTDVFLLKLDTAGSYSWAISRGSTSANDVSSDIGLDANGNIFWQTYLDVSWNFYKIDNNGNEIWNKNVPGIALHLDISGNIYITGNFESTFDFDPGPGVFNLTAVSNVDDIFILKLDNDGNFIWVKQIEESGYGTGTSVTVDNNNSVYVTGFFSGTADFDPSVTIYNISESGTQQNGDIFYLKLDSNGDFIWAHRIGGDYTEEGGKICLNSNGDLFVSGTFKDTVDVDPSSNVFNLTSTLSGNDAFIIKLSSTVGVTEEQNVTNVLIYPNPVSGSLIVSSTELIYSITITDMLGKIVYQSEPKNYLNKTELNVATGIYIVVIHTDDEVIIKKIAVE